jgi:hypothetical protein
MQRNSFGHRDPAPGYVPPEPEQKPAPKNEPPSPANGKPSIGRIVHYIIPDGQHRPAVIVTTGKDGETLRVLTLLADAIASEEVTASQGEEAGNWHWPERP